MSQQRATRLLVQIFNNDLVRSLSRTDNVHYLSLIPIKGAGAYFMRLIVYDWLDEELRGVFGHLEDAMDLGYSTAESLFGFPIYVADFHRRPSQTSKQQDKTCR
jgi:hypothetical protein